MSNFSLMQRGVIQIISSDTSPKEIALASAVRSQTAKLTYGVKDRRRDAFVQHGSIAITDADVSPKDSSALGTAVDTAAAHVTNVTVREKRTNNFFGATVKLNSSTIVRATFGTVAAGDTIDIDFDVVEFKSRRGVLVRLKDDENLEVLWDGTLGTGETIDITYNLLDLDAIGNSLLEADFKLLRALGYLGENQVVDSVEREFGQQSTYRIRIFDSKANAEAATLGIADGSDFEEGELARVTRTIDIDVKNNDRDSMVRVLTKLADTPGVEE